MNESQNRIAAIIRAKAGTWKDVEWRRFADRIEAGEYGGCEHECHVCIGNDACRETLRSEVEV